MGLFQLGGCTLQHHGARAGWRVQVAQGYAVAGFIWLFTIYLVFLLQDALSGKCCHPAETQPGPFDRVSLHIVFASGSVYSLDGWKLSSACRFLEPVWGQDKK